jgi:hypothetical protein
MKTNETNQNQIIQPMKIKETRKKRYDIFIVFVFAPMKIHRLKIIAFLIQIPTFDNCHVSTKKRYDLKRS